MSAAATAGACLSDRGEDQERDLLATTARSAWQFAADWACWRCWCRSRWWVSTDSTLCLCSHWAIQADRVWTSSVLYFPEPRAHRKRLEKKLKNTYTCTCTCACVAALATRATAPTWRHIALVRADDFGLLDLDVLETGEEVLQLCDDLLERVRVRALQRHSQRVRVVVEQRADRREVAVGTDAS